MSTLSGILVQITHWGVSILIDGSLKAAAVLLAAVIAARLLRGSSAAVRHRVWSLGLIGALLMPVLSLTVPQVRLPILPPQVETGKLAHLPFAKPGAPVTSNTDNEAGIELKVISEPQGVDAMTDPSRPQLQPNPLVQARAATFDKPSPIAAASSSGGGAGANAPGTAATSVDFRVYAFAAWLGGLLIVLVPLVYGFAVNWLLLRNSQRLENGRWSQLVADLSAQIGLKRRVAAFESPQPVVPMTWGLICPTVLLPKAWRNWSEQRRRCVLLHELAHIKRFDVCFQILGRLAAGCYWFNPLIWYALRQLRIERELACDDCVLASGERPSVYAQELVQIARLYRPRLLALGVAMASSARLDQRVLGILDGARSRFPVSSRLASFLFAASALLVLTLAATGVGERSVTAVAVDNAANQSQIAQEATKERANVPEQQQSAAGDKVIVSGVVVGPDGKPVAGANIYAIEVKVRSYLEATRLLTEAVAGSDGAFTCQFPEADRGNVSGFNQWMRRQYRVQLVATAENYSIGFASREWRRQSDAVRIQLAPRESLTGQLIDLEGRPLSDVRIEVASIAQSDQPLGEWFKLAAANRRPDEQSLMMSAASKADRPQPVRFPSNAGAALAGTGIIPGVKTDADGRFTIPGVGPNRLVAMQAAAPAIARTTFNMVTHPGPAVFDAYPDPRVRDGMIRGAGSTVAIEPSVAIRGTVVEADTGRPIDACRVEVTQVAGSLMGLEDYAAATTDKSGQYVIAQLPADPPNSRGFRLRFTPPSGTPFFPTESSVRVSGNERTFDVRLPRARLITGRIIDEQTRQPVRALVGYLPTLDNKGAAEFPNFVAGMRTLGYYDFCWNETDGAFRVPAINGRGVLCVAAERMAAYTIAGGAGQIGGLDGEGNKFGLYHLHASWMVNEFREIQLTAENADPEIEVALRPLSQRTVRIVDSDGKPVTGCLATGLMPDVPMAARMSLSMEKPQRAAEVQVIGLEAESPRPLAVLHPQRKLGAVSVMRNTDDRQNEPLVVALMPCGQISGRLLDESGQPLPGRRIQALGLLDIELPPPKYGFSRASFSTFAETVQTRADGRFDIASGVIPGIRYRISVQNDGPAMERRVGQPAVVDPFSKDTPLIEPGAAIDIGDLKPSQEQAAVQPPDAKAVPASKDNNQQQLEPAKVAAPATVQGQVVDIDGKPIARAKIYIRPSLISSGSDSKARPQLAATSNDAGAFQFSFDGKLGDGPFGAQVLIAADGHGSEWLPMSEAMERRGIDVKLPKDLPINGRILTLEGQPVEGAKISVRSIRAMNDDSLTPYIEAVKAGNGGNFGFDKHLFEAPHLGTVTTDADGRFRILGIGQNRVVELEVAGRSIQHATLHVMTLVSEPIQPRAGRGFAKMQKEFGEPPVFGATFEWLARPSRPIVGTVVDAKTGRPLAGIGVSSLFDAHGTTDVDGRFELIGAAKANNYRLMVSASDQPYLQASKSVADTPGLAPLEVTLEMTRGIVVTGRVTDRATGRPVAARLVYFPLHPNEHVIKGIGGSEARAMGAFCERQTNTAGEFSIAVLPGPGFIGVSAQDRGGYQPASVDPEAFYKQEGVPYGTKMRGPVNSMWVADGGGGWSSMPQSQFHEIEFLNLPAESDDSTRRGIQLRPANKLSGVVLDPAGEPIAGTAVFGLADDGFGSPRTVSGSEFVVSRLGDSEKRTLLFRHEPQRLTGVVEVAADMQQPIRVTLLPWGEVSGRMIDEDGQPLANLEIGSIGGAKAGESLGRLPRMRSTDDQGRFRIDGLVPGLTYAIRPRERVKPEVRIVVKPGEKLDVGEVSGTYESGAVKPK